MSLSSVSQRAFGRLQRAAARLLSRERRRATRPGRAREHLEIRRRVFDRSRRTRLRTERGGDIVRAFHARLRARAASVDRTRVITVRCETNRNETKRAHSWPFIAHLGEDVEGRDIVDHALERGDVHVARESRRARGRLRTRGGAATRAATFRERTRLQTREAHVKIVDVDNDATMLFGEYFTDRVPGELAHASLEVQFGPPRLASVRLHVLPELYRDVLANDGER